MISQRVCGSSPIGVGSSLLKHAETKKLHQFSSRMLKPSIFAGDSKQNTKIKYAVFWSSVVFLLIFFSVIYNLSSEATQLGSEMKNKVKVGII